jgi:bla regulator protein blaR1
MRARAFLLPRGQTQDGVQATMSQAASRRRVEIRRLGLAWAASVLLSAVCVLAQTGAAVPQATNSTSPAAPAAPAAALAQSGLSQPLAFDVVSIRPFPRNNMMIRIRTTPDGVWVSGMPMHMVMREAFGVTNDQLLGEPDWVATDRYDIEAKVSPEDAPKLKELSDEQRWAMLLPALEDRCELRFHHETKELTAYMLVIAKGGLKMQPAGTGPTPGPTTAPPPPPGPGAGMFFMARSVTMASLVHMLSRTLGSPVIDKTGLTGKYDLRLQFAPDDSVRASMPPVIGGAPPTETDGPSIFTALQEQLGLKLVAQKEPVDVIVIDHVEQPTAN